MAHPSGPGWPSGTGFAPGEGPFPTEVMLDARGTGAALQQGQGGDGPGGGSGWHQLREPPGAAEAAEGEVGSEGLGVHGQGGLPEAGAQHVGQGLEGRRGREAPPKHPGLGPTGEGPEPLGLEVEGGGTCGGRGRGRRHRAEAIGGQLAEEGQGEMKLGGVDGPEAEALGRRPGSEGRLQGLRRPKGQEEAQSFPSF